MAQTGQSPLDALRQSQTPPDLSGKYANYAAMPSGMREQFLQALTRGQPQQSLARNRILSTIEQDPSAGDALLRKAGMMRDAVAGTAPGAASSASAGGAQVPLPPARPSGIDDLMSKDGTGMSPGAAGMGDMDSRLMGGLALNGATADQLQQGPTAASAGGGNAGPYASIMAAIMAGGGIAVALAKLKQGAPDIAAAIQSGKMNLQQAAADPRVQQLLVPGPTRGQGLSPDVLSRMPQTIDRNVGAMEAGGMMPVSPQSLGPQNIPGMLQQQSPLQLTDQRAIRLPDRSGESSGRPIQMPDESAPQSAIPDAMLADDVPMPKKNAPLKQFNKVPGAERLKVRIKS